MIYTVINKRIKGGPLEISYDVIQELSFQLDVSGTGGLYIACGLDLQHNPNELLFYSDSCSYSDGVLTFTVNTYTENFLNRVTNFSTKAWLEIGRMLEGNKAVLLFDDIIVQPRVYLEGEPPEPVPSSQYATMLWVSTNFQPTITPSAKLDVNLVSGAASQTWTEENFQPIITSDDKLDYSLISGTPLIGNGKLAIYQGTELKGEFYANASGNVTIDLDAGGGGGGVTSGWVEENFEPLITENRKLDASLISGLTPGGVTSSYVNDKISEHNLAADAHSSLFSNKQDNITATNKLAYSLLSGTPTIPTVNNPTITLKQGTSTIGSFTLNQSGGATFTFTEGATETWVTTNFQPIITSSRKLAYSLLSGTPTIPTVNNATITFTQGGVTKGSINLNQSSNETIALDAGGGSTPGSGIITLTQGGVIKGSFNVNQSNNQTINLDAGGGGGGSMTYYQIYSSDTVLTAYHDCSYFWALKNQNATLYCEHLQTANYDIPIDINLSGSTVTLSGITRNGLFADGCVNRCLITKRYDNTILYIYAYEAGYDMTQGLVGTWTTLGTDSATYAGAAQVYTETTAGHYDSADGTYFIEARGTNWRLFTSADTEIAMGPASSDPMQGDYGTVAMAPLAGDSVLTVSLENIIVRS